MLWCSRVSMQTLVFCGAPCLPAGRYLSVETGTNLQQAVALPAMAEWLARGSPFAADEILSLFENNSPLLRDNPYALGVPLNTLRALRSDWRVFRRFCGVNGYSPLPSSPL